MPQVSQSLPFHAKWIHDSTLRDAFIFIMMDHEVEESHILNEFLLQKMCAIRAFLTQYKCNFRASFSSTISFVTYWFQK